MRIVVHGQQAFGKSVLEALLERGENVVGVYCAPDPAGGRVEPRTEAALARRLPGHPPNSCRGNAEGWAALGPLSLPSRLMSVHRMWVSPEGR